MSPAQRYAELEMMLLAGRASGALFEASDEEIVEEMTDLWYRMTADEHHEANRRAQAIVRGMHYVAVTVALPVGTVQVSVAGGAPASGEQGTTTTINLLRAGLGSVAWRLGGAQSGTLVSNNRREECLLHA